jgi:hypothetical protein
MGKNPFIRDEDEPAPAAGRPGSGPEPYRGPERRSGNDRRKTNDRREEIRFELAKEDRRSGKDRRRRSGWDDTPVR